MTVVRDCQCVGTPQSLLMVVITAGTGLYHGDWSEHIQAMPLAAAKWVTVITIGWVSSVFKSVELDGSDWMEDYKLGWVMKGSSIYGSKGRVQNMPWCGSIGSVFSKPNLIFLREPNIRRNNHHRRIVQSSLFTRYDELLQRPRIEETIKVRAIHDGHWRIAPHFEDVI